MPTSWRHGLTSAFPVPDGKRKNRKRAAISTKDAVAAIPEPSESAAIDPFPFLSLPPEIRTKVYQLILFRPPRTPVDPKPKPSDASTLAVLRVCHLVYSETTHLLYTQTPFPLFHIQSFPPLPTPLLIPPRQRATIKALHLRLGNSWSAPPKTWRVSKMLARVLPKFTSLHMLKVFVELDPSEPMFDKYRISKNFYTDFAGELLAEVLKAMTQVEVVEVGGYEFVNVSGPLVTRIRQAVLGSGKTLQWSEENGMREKVRRLDSGETPGQQPEDEPVDEIALPTTIALANLYRQA